MIRRHIAAIAAAASLGLAAAPAAAQQFSESYKFLKAVKDGDGAKVTDFVNSPGTTVVNSRDRETGDGGLHIVVRDRNIDWLSFLLAKGARRDLQNNAGETPLALAARIGWTEGAQLLLAQRASVDLANGRGETPLILAVHNRDPAMVRLLLGAGANPKRTDSVAGYSALDYARQDRRSTQIAKMLEEGPAKPAKEVAGPSL